MFELTSMIMASLVLIFSVFLATSNWYSRTEVSILCLIAGVSLALIFHQAHVKDVFTNLIPLMEDILSNVTTVNEKLQK